MKAEFTSDAGNNDLLIFPDTPEELELLRAWDNCNVGACFTESVTSKGNEECLHIFRDD